jgi:SAM-dependent methyltransferase
MIYINGSSLLIKNCCVCPVGAHLIWTSSTYKFIIEDKINRNGEQTYKEVYIDVTDSVPSNLDTPSAELSKVLDQVLSMYPKRYEPLILDFGAGKLRNTLYLLKKGYDVRAVEFEKISKGTKKAKEAYAEAETYGNKFENLVFPHEFFKSKEEFDLILLINVCSIMPVPSERYLVLQYCRDRLKTNGFILWYTIHTDRHNKERCKQGINQLGDGYYFNEDKYYQTFYLDPDYNEVDRMFYSSGFRQEKPFSVPHNVVKLFRKVAANPIPTQILNAEIIRKYVKGDVTLPKKKSTGVRILKQKEVKNSDINDPNPDGLCENELYIQALRNLKVGLHASEYHNLIYAILLKLFIPPLKNPEVEFPLDEGDQRIDIVMYNGAPVGFFNDIVIKNKIHAPYIIIECKNYQDNVGNPELSQIVDRFGDRTGEFGFLIYRSSTKEREFFKKCANRRNRSGNCIIPLNDNDIIQMLELQLEGEKIDDFLTKKLQALDFNI